MRNGWRNRRKTNCINSRFALTFQKTPKWWMDRFSSLVWYLSIVNCLRFRGNVIWFEVVESVVSLTPQVALRSTMHVFVWKTFQIICKLVHITMTWRITLRTDVSDRMNSFIPLPKSSRMPKDKKNDYFGICDSIQVLFLWFHLFVLSVNPQNEYYPMDVGIELKNCSIWIRFIKCSK